MELEITGVVDFVTFYNADNGYTILKMIPDEAEYAHNGNGTLTVVGNMAETLAVGDAVMFEGYWVDNPQYGRQLRATSLVKLKKRSASRVVVPASSPAPSAEVGAKLRGTIERITFYNEDNGWGVLKISPIDKNYPEEAMSYDGMIAVVGIMPEVVEGEMAEFTGRWVNNEQYGKQFRADQVVPIAPRNKDGIIRYISDTVFGIGDVTATKIYNHFGDRTLEILDSDPEKIRDVGIKRTLEDNFITAWSSSRVMRQIMIHLQSYGITSKFAKRIYDAYGAQTLHIIQADPYQLADDLFGVGFKKADQIAQGMGVAQNARSRMRAGLVYTLSQMANDGHTYAPRDALIEQARELLGVQGDDAIDFEGEIREQILAGKLKADVLYLEEGQIGAVYLPMFYHSEVGSAERLRIMASSPSKLITKMKDTKWDKYLKHLAKQNNVNLSDQQQGAVKGALTNKISVLTGGPGTGKTTTLQMVINALKEEECEFRLASPTGRAAKRLSEATQEQAMTIHRLLGFNPQEGGFEYDEDNPLPADVVVIDESSMLDLILFYNLLKALRPSCHLMLVGDVDQLPSVGAGNVLKDVINSGIAFVTRLDQIFRQEDASHIIMNAHRVNHGDMPITDNNSDDFFFFGVEDPQEAADLVVDIVVNRLGKKVGDYDPISHVQVIAPMYRGPIGVHALNQALQETLNPHSSRTAEKRFGAKVFRRGDKVMQTKNNYEKEVFNGDIGLIYGIDDDENLIRVNMDGRMVDYNYEDAEEQLIHAFCISTHRSQGSEYPIVVMPVMSQHYMMLQRNLLYTAITRARTMVVLVGMRKALAMAVSNNKVAERYSGLLPRLKMGK